MGPGIAAASATTMNNPLPTSVPRPKPTDSVAKTRASGKGQAPVEQKKNVSFMQHDYLQNDDLKIYIFFNIYTPYFTATLRHTPLE